MPEARRGHVPTSPKMRRRTLAVYEATTQQAQGHIRVRWRTCPFDSVAALVPRAGRVLEIGCGHGVFSTYLALGSPEREVVGVDIAPDKIEAARAAARAARRAGANLTFELTTPGELPAGPWDAVVILDVLYLLPPEAEAALVRHAAQVVSPGGALLIKEMALQPRWKLLWCAFQELMAVRVARITTGQELAWTGPEQMASWLRDEGLDVEEHPLHHGYLHPHHLLVGRR